MYLDGSIYLGLADGERVTMPLSVANRHGLIAGATGTGKTVTMKVLAESFSDAGVPVFLCDIKGDVSGLCMPGDKTEGMEKRIDKFGIRDSFQYRSYPVCFWDVYGEKGHPVRATVSDIGPTLLSRILGLTDAQEGVLNIVFRVADDMGMELRDYKDLRSMVNYVSEHKSEYTTVYGNIATASVGAVIRSLLPLEDQGADLFFGEPMLDIRDWMRTDFTGRGYINILTSTRLINSPTVYATFLLWLMTELFEKLPEVGDVEKPRVVFFFDEAHFLFTDAPKALVQKIVQVVKLVRSKGVGVYFVTQSPSDIPDDVLAQLSNRIQHALRAYTPAEQKAVRAAASAFRVNPEFDTEEAIMALGVGQALVSCLDEKGVPTIVERARILPPQSLMGAADESFVQSAIAADEFDLKYRDSVDRESAYEIIMKATEELKAQKEAELEAAKAEKEAAKAEKEAAKAEKEAAKTGKKTSSKAGTAVKKAGQKAVNSAASSVATAVGNNLINSVTGGKKTSTSTIAKRAAGNALKSLMRSGTSSIIRGLFGNIK